MGENGLRLAEAVRHEINTMPHVKTALGQGIINYSALSRLLLPSLSRKLTKKPNEESIIVSIKRYADELGASKAEMGYLEMFAAAEITMQDSMAYARFKKTDKLVSTLEKLFEEEEWKIGEMRIFIEGGEQTIVIAKKDRLEKLFKGLENLPIITDRALISFWMPLNAKSTYGIIAELSNILAKKGVSFELVTSPTDLHFLVDEKEAETAYHELKETIKEAKKNLEDK